ncbi:IS3 family transposase [Anaerotalea alkaliphila]|uniref:IS3 family transposase n=1 Tax=Anaerotalea alkaliphila TaxID=2662126 RepID=A0A7X5HTP3_9FIRM|nr:IS3 family transposase [Anaerotalea alkaliphila]
MLDDTGCTQSMSRVGRCLDNAPMEGFGGILKCEMYYLNKFSTYTELEREVEEYTFWPDSPFLLFFSIMVHKGKAWGG